MKNYKIYFVFCVAVALITAAVYYVSIGYYPIATVNGSFITEKTFSENYNTASFYYRNILKAYAATSTDSMNSFGNGLPQNGTSSSTPKILTPAEIQQSVLSGLVENILIENGARKEIGEELDRLVTEKVNQAAGTPGTGKAVGAIYGLSLADFKKEILVPQAERDILTGSLFLKGQKIEDWLIAEKKASKVMIFSGKFYWNGEDVAIKR